MDDLLVKIENIGDQLRGYTEKLVFSFADITVYRKVKKNLDDAGVHYLEWTKDQMIELAKRLVALNKRKGGTIRWQLAVKPQTLKVWSITIVLMML